MANKYVKFCDEKFTIEKFLGFCDLNIFGLVTGMLGIIASGFFFILFYLFMINLDTIAEDSEVESIFMYSKLGEWCFLLHFWFVKLTQNNF